MNTHIFTVGIDANEANVIHRVGSNIYAFKILKQLERQSKENNISWLIFLSRPPVGDLPLQRVGWTYVVIKPSSLWTQWRLPLELFIRRKQIDVFLSLGHYAPRFSPTPTIICILDLAFIHFPQFFLKKDLYQLLHWTSYSAKNAHKIITISQNSKQDIINAYHKKSEDIIIAYPGIEPLLKDESLHNNDAETSILKNFGLEKGKYLVSIGTIQPRKNMIRIVEAFEALGTKKPESAPLSLVFIGKQGWLTTDFDERVQRSACRGNIIVTGFVDEITKYALLKNSGASILIGYYEGFGIPVLESLSVGIQPIIANTGSLPEVDGSFGIRVDPYNSTNISLGIAQAFANHPTDEQKTEMVKWAHTFSWERSGTVILNLLNDMKVSQ